MKTFIWWVKFILLFIWQLPQNIVALVMLPFLGKLKLVRKANYNYCFEGTNMLGGISLGSFCFVSKHSAKSNETVAHEQDGHVKQSHLLGPLYLLVIGLFSITWAGLYKRLGYKNYYIFYTESWANKLAGLEVYEYYPGYFRIRFIKNKRTI
jgi:hypothetical protein